MAAKKRRRIAPLILVLFIAAGIGVGVYFILNPSSARMGEEVMDSVMEVRGIVIRNETVVQRGEAYHIQYLVNDGDYVQSAQPIVNTYSRGYDTQLAQIIALEQQIYDQQSALLQLQYGESALPDSLTQINADIDSCIDKIMAANSGEGGEDFLTLQSNLYSLMSERTALMQQLVTPDEALTNSMNQLSALQSSFTQKTTLVNDGSAGYISFTTDGYESALSTDQLNTTQVTDILSGYGSISPSTSDLYRIIAADHWYVAFNVSIDSPERLIEGQTYSMLMAGSDTVYSAYCSYARTFTSTITYVVEIYSDTKPILNTRSGTFSFSRSASGATVRLDGLTYESGVPTVMVKQGDEYVAIPVYILCSDEENAVIVAQDSSIQLRSGLRYDIP
ncbi:MAG: HlyD family efflux transporter periplasmic adaptor subunit [Clostridia bacterium]|nr:HlyD family efflux transporter periplasmic adaptor subunit [Clostridia bacterium]